MALCSKTSTSRAHVDGQSCGQALALRMGPSGLFMMPRSAAKPRQSSGQRGPRNGALQRPRLQAAARCAASPPQEAAMAAKVRIGILGASGYTGSELMRLLLRHPRAELSLLTAESKAGKPVADVFPQFAPFGLPDLVTVPSDWSAAEVDFVFCALPHGTTQIVV